MQVDRRDESVYQPCEEFEPLLVLLAAGELNPAELAEVADHLAHCTGCTAAVEENKELLGLIRERHAEPDAALLASCRAGLEDALDREEERSWLRRLAGAVIPPSMLAPRPAWSAALLLLVGFSIGVLGPRFLRHPIGNEAPNASADLNGAGVATSDPTSAPIDIHTAEVAGINVFPSGGNEPPQVELQLRAQQPVRVQGTVNNENVKTVLLNILRNNDRFDPDVRLDAVDLLRARNNDPEVRAVLCHAVHTDRNAAVRLKALEALNGAEPQDIIRQTLLDALVDDQNPGVRVEAINALREMAAKGQVVSDDHMLAVLRERTQKDPSTYIRLQSAAAIRDLGPRQKF
jgi:hypothetical protein